MRVSGFTFIRNGSILGYPYIASIKSLLPVCDEVIVAVGKSDDDTLAQVKAINDPKIIVIETAWNELMQDRGYTYAQQKMIAQFNCTGDWAFYLECDEVLHEDDVPLIRAQMAKYLADTKVEALIFDYYHFYGCPQNYVYSPRWYRKAPRIIRNTIRSWAPDGLFWIIMDQNRQGRYPYAADVGCYIYHYGHVRKSEFMAEKDKRVQRYWGKESNGFSGYSDIDSSTVLPFKSSHPKIITDWLEHSAEKSFKCNPDYKLTKRDKKHRILSIISKLIGGFDFSKKHYKLIRR
jgi:glycosyltransferase involved in cell wall biosynthesis